MKLRHFYRIDKDKKPIPGSNISAYHKPKHATWKEIENPCCVTPDIECFCGPRYFVQLDAGNKPVRGTLIKRLKKPEQQSTRYMEISQYDMCCFSIEGFSAVVVIPESPVFADENNQYEFTISSTPTGTPDQLEGIVSVNYYASDVLVATVNGNEITNPGHPANITLTLPFNADFIYEMKAEYTFKSGATYTTPIEELEVRYDGPPEFAPMFNGPQAVTGIVMQTNTIASLAGWVSDTNIVPVVITATGLPPFALFDTYSFAGKKAFNIGFELPASTGTYNIQIQADDGVHPPVVKNITLNVTNSTYNPLEYPLGIGYPLTIAHGDVTPRTYDKVGNNFAPVNLSNATGAVDPEFTGGSLSNQVIVIPGYSPGKNGDGLILVAWGANATAIEDMFLLQVTITP